MQAASADSPVGFLDGHGAVELCGGNGLHRLTAQSVSLTGRTDAAWLYPVELPVPYEVA